MTDCFSYGNFHAAGQVVIDTSLPFRSNNYSKILTVSPIAVPASKKAQFSVKGVNLIRPATRYCFVNSQSFAWFMEYLSSRTSFKYIYVFVELPCYMTLKPTIRLMCALEGKYLVCEDAHMSMDQGSNEPDELQCVQFSCSVPVMNGRGFIEVLFLHSPKLSTLKCRDEQASFSMKKKSTLIY